MRRGPAAAAAGSPAAAQRSSGAQGAEHSKTHFKVDNKICKDLLPFLYDLSEHPLLGQQVALQLQQSLQYAQGNFPPEKHNYIVDPTTQYTVDPTSPVRCERGVGRAAGVFGELTCPDAKQMELG